MTYDIGTARGVIEIMYNGRGVATARADLTGLEKTANVAKKQVLGGFKAMGLGGFALATAIGYVLKVNSDFEKQLSGIQAVSGATADEMDALRNKALQLGADTIFSASEAAGAMEELAKAGISTEDVLNGAADAAVALAAAGGIGIPEAATIAANAMNQFNLEASDLAGVVDNIAGAANASAIDVTDLGQALTQVGAVANLAGFSFEDMSTAIALMGNAGIKGSDAGTSLKSMIQRLQPVTKKQALEFKELGLITEDGSNKFFDAQGNIKSYADIAGILSGSLKKMSNEQKLAALQTLFGSDAIRAAAVAADAGRKGVKALNDEMHKTTAAEVAATRMDNFAGSVEQLRGSIDTAIIQGGSAALPVLRDFVDFLTRGVNAAPALAHSIKDELGPGFHDLFDAIGDVIQIGIQVIDMFDGIVGVVAKLGLGVVVVTFTTLASILDTVTGLLEGQGAVVAIVAGSWILLANGGIGLVISRLGLFAALAVSKALSGLLALQEGNYLTLASFQALAAGASAAMASVAAVALLVAAVIIWNAYRQAVEDTKQALEDAANAQSSGNFGETAAGLDALNKKIAERRALIEDIDVTGVKDAGKFLNNAFNPSRWGDVGKLGEYKDNMDQLEATSADLSDTITVMGGALTSLATEFGVIDPAKAQEMMDALSSGNPDAIAQFDDLLKQMQPLLDKAGISADAFGAALANSGSLLGGVALGVMSDQLRAVARDSDSASDGQSSLTSAVEAFSNQALTAEDAAKALKQALDELIGVQLNAEEAGIKWRDALQKLQDGLKGVGNEMFNNTQIGDANKQLVIDATNATLDRVTAEAKAGTSIGAITKMFGAQRQALIESAGPTKAAQDAMRNYLNTLNFTPRSVKTLVEAVGVDRAQKHVEKLTAKYKLTPDQVTTIFTAAGAESAAAKVKALRDYIKTLKGKTAPVTAPGAPEANTQIADLQKKIKDLKGKDAPVGTPGAAEAATQIAALRDRINELRDRQVYIDIITRHIGDAVGSTDTEDAAPLVDGNGRLASGGATPSPPPVGTFPPKTQRSTGGGDRRSLRLIQGRLTLDKSGRAYIRGIAEEAVADGNSYSDTLDRMG